MSSDLNFVKYVVDQIDAACEVTYRMMFGGCTLYSKGKVVALICDVQLCGKPTDAGRAFIGDVVEAPPYPGAKLSFLIGDQIEKSEWLTQLIQLTEEVLPKPKPPKNKQKQKKKKKN